MRGQMRKPEEGESPQGLLTIREVARLLNAHPNSIRRWADMGLLASCRVGIRGDRRFKPEDVSAFLEAERDPGGRLRGVGPRR